MTISADAARLLDRASPASAKAKLGTVATQCPHRARR